MRASYTLIEVTVAACIMAVLAGLTWVGVRGALPALGAKEELSRLERFLAAARSRATVAEDVLVIEEDAAGARLRDLRGHEITRVSLRAGSVLTLSATPAYALPDGALTAGGGALAVEVARPEGTAVCRADGIYGPVITERR